MDKKFRVHVAGFRGEEGYGGLRKLGMGTIIQVGFKV